MIIMVCDNIEELGEDFVAWAETVLPDWRKEQMLAIKHLRGRVQCAVAWLLVHHCQMSEGGLFTCGECSRKLGSRRGAARNDSWIYNEHGKPFFEGRDDLFFSISHCKGAVAVAIDNKEVGVDIEEISRYREGLESYVLNEEEVPRCARNDKLRAECFIEIWTQKEAVFKLLGTGITHDIKDVLKNHPEVNVYSERIGDKILSIATQKFL